VAAVVSEASWELFATRLDEPGGAVGKQLTSDAPIQSFSWTPDDKMILWQTSSLSLVDPATGSRSRLNIPADGSPSQPSVCPDGHLVFVLSKTGGDEGRSIWRSDANGQNPARLTEGRYAQFPMCSADSQAVYYEDFAQGRSTFWKVSAAGGKAQSVGDFTMSRCLWCDRLFDLSPDGKWAALPIFVGYDPRLKLLLVPLPTASPARVIEFRQPSLFPVIRFFRDSQWLAYLVRNQGVDNLWVQQVDGPGFRQLTHFSSGRIPNFELSPRGDLLAYSRVHQVSDIVLLRHSTR
jgi:Tol biopolymer transport system component